MNLRIWPDKNKYTHLYWCEKCLFSSRSTTLGRIPVRGVICDCGQEVVPHLSVMDGEENFHDGCRERDIVNMHNSYPSVTFKERHKALKAGEWPYVFGPENAP